MRGRQSGSVPDAAGGTVPGASVPRISGALEHEGQLEGALVLD